MKNTIRRSALFTPADDPEMMRKAATFDADGLIFDLEDAVPPAKKQVARENLREVVQETDFGDTEVATRIDGLDTEWWLADLSAATEAGVDAITVPKVESATEVATLLRTAEQVVGGSAPFGGDEQVASDVPQFRLTLESPEGVFHGADIATYCRDEPAVTGLSFGIADYCRAIGAPEVSTRVREFLDHLVRGYATIGNLDAFEPVYLDIEDTEGLRETAERARDLGYDGMTAIHPEQIAVINDVFTPSEERVEEARNLVREFDASDRDSLLVDGVFLDTATVDRYRDLIDRYEAIHERD